MFPVALETSAGMQTLFCVACSRCAACERCYLPACAVVVRGPIMSRQFHGGRPSDALRPRPAGVANQWPAPEIARKAPWLVQLLKSAAECREQRAVRRSRTDSGCQSVPGTSQPSAGCVTGGLQSTRRALAGAVIFQLALVRPASVGNLRTSRQRSILGSNEAVAMGALNQIALQRQLLRASAVCSRSPLLAGAGAFGARRFNSRTCRLSKLKHPLAVVEVRIAAKQVGRGVRLIEITRPEVRKAQHQIAAIGQRDRGQQIELLA